MKEAKGRLFSEGDFHWVRQVRSREGEGVVRFPKLLTRQDDFLKAFSIVCSSAQGKNACIYRAIGLFSHLIFTDLTACLADPELI